MAEPEPLNRARDVHCMEFGALIIGESNHGTLGGGCAPSEPDPRLSHPGYNHGSQTIAGTSREPQRSCDTDAVCVLNGSIICDTHPPNLESTDATPDAWDMFDIQSANASSDYRVEKMHSQTIGARGCRKSRPEN